MRSGEHLPEHNAEREQVGAGVDLLSKGLLGRHIGELALEHAGHRLGQPVDGLGHAEVAQLHVPLEAKEDVVRRDVAVHQVKGHARGVGGAVGVLEGEGDLRRDPDRDRHRNLHRLFRGALEHLAQVLAVDVLHAHEPLAVDLAQLEQPHDVAVVEPRRDLGLVEEQPEEAGVLGQVGEDSLDHPIGRANRGHSAGVSGPGKEHLAHAAHAQLPDKLVPAEREAH